MKKIAKFAALIASSCLAVATPVVAQTAQDDARFQQAQQRFDTELQIFRQEFDRYQAARANSPRGGYRGGYNDQRGYNDYNDDRVESGYDPSRYYRAGPNYQERVLSADERVVLLDVEEHRARRIVARDGDGPARERRVEHAPELVLGGGGADRLEVDLFAVTVAERDLTAAAHVSNIAILARLARGVPRGA